MTSPQIDSKTNEKLSSLRIEPERKLPRRSRAGAIIILCIGIAVGLLLGGFLLRMKPAEAAPAPVPAEQAAPANTAPAPPSDLLLTTTGYVTPRHRISLSPQVMGQVVWVGIEKGDRVEKDQVLVRLDDADYQARVREAEASMKAAEARLDELKNGARPEELAGARANVAEAEAVLALADIRLQRAQVLVKENEVDSQATLDSALSERDAAAARLESARQALALMEAGTRAEQIDAATASLESARAAVELARIAVDDTIIKAPVAGTILEKLIEVGELVSPQNFGGTRGARTELLSLADLRELQVEVDVNQSDFARISMGQPARVVLDAYPDKTYQGKVREIAPEADRQKATVQVKVAILDPDNLVLPEMSARVDFLKGE